MRTSAAVRLPTSEINSRRRDLPSAFEPTKENCSEIIVVGAGLAGTTAAMVLEREDRQVTLIDPHATCPPVFKAEKLEPDQVRMLRKFRLLDLLLPRASRIREIHACYNGRRFGTSQTEQYGANYADIVNTLRSHLPPSVQFRAERVVEIRNSSDLQKVKLAGGQELTCRLVVLASGLNAQLPRSLGLTRSAVQKNQSIALGFTIARNNGQPFSFDSLTYYSVSPKFGLDYVSFFPIGGEVRANLFAFPKANDPWIREFTREPNEGLRACFPKLQCAIGEYRVTSEVEAAVVHLYRTEGGPPPGVALIGDAAQNVCPSTGMGLNKILTDVDVLSQFVPLWLSSAGMHSDKLGGFFNHPEKRAVDTKALRNAFYRRQAATGSSLKWKIHRMRLHASMQFRRPTQMEPSRS